jgi:hypothetical protein
MQPFKSPTAAFVFALCMPQNKVLPTLPSGEGKVGEIVSFAARNGVAPWCFYQLKTHDLTQHPDLLALQQKLKGYYLQTLVLNQQRYEAFRQIQQLFQNHHLEVVALKGLALAFSLYPEEALRPMGDIDLLIPSSQVYEARDLILAHGGKPMYVPLSPLHDRVHAHISALVWKGIMVEPHQRLFGLGSPFNPKNVPLFERIITTAGHPELKIFDDELMTYHLTAHLIKGYKMGGMRLSWFLDIALLLQRNQQNPEFKAAVTGLHPSIKTEITNALEWASLLLDPSPPLKALHIPFPEEDLFIREQNTSKKHKKIVLNEIAHLPGIHLKIYMLFRELFPSPAYMNNQYGNHKGLSLILLYAKRLFGQAHHR